MTTEESPFRISHLARFPGFFGDFLRRALSVILILFTLKLSTASFSPLCLFILSEKYGRHCQSDVDAIFKLSIFILDTARGNIFGDSLIQTLLEYLFDQTGKPTGDGDSATNPNDKWSHNSAVSSFLLFTVLDLSHCTLFSR